MISSFYEKIVGTSLPSEQNHPKILCIGLCCLDIVQTCNEYPIEDSDQSSIDYRWQRGGNSSNTCTVLSLLGSPCEFLGTMSTEHNNFLQNDMLKYHIDFSHCPIVEGMGCPTSTVLLSLNSGSRTIVHNNQKLPELTLKNFEQLNLDDYSWIHFEGRNTIEVLSMMQCIESHNNSLRDNRGHGIEKSTSTRFPITVSVELEKPRVQELLDLLPYIDVAFISKDFSRSRGFDNMSETLKNISKEAKSGATMICAWGDRGAMARTPDGILVQSPAFPPHRILDTLGAGDSFNAAMLHYLNKIKIYSENNNGTDDNQHINEIKYQKIQKNRKIRQNSNIESLECSQTDFIDQNVLQSALMFACRVAGSKIGIKGYDQLKDIVKTFDKID